MSEETPLRKKSSQLLNMINKAVEVKEEVITSTPFEKFAKHKRIPCDMILDIILSILLFLLVLFLSGNNNDVLR
jgi:hypothetical protein